MCSWFGGPWFGGGMFMMIIFWAVVIAGGVALFRAFTRRSQNDREMPMNTALEILKQRYAKGEISHEEFEKMKANLS